MGREPVLVSSWPPLRLARLRRERGSVGVAAEASGNPVAVLPYEPARERWLLKLHGCIAPDRRHDIVLTRGDYLSRGSTERRSPGSSRHCWSPATCSSWDLALATTTFMR